MNLIYIIFICIIRDEEDDNNYGYEAEMYLEDQTTRYYLCYLACCIYLCLYVCSKPSPAVDETNVGNRDAELIKTYRDFSNLRYVLLILNYLFLLTILFLQGGLYAILDKPASNVAVFHRNCVRHP